RLNPGTTPVTTPSTTTTSVTNAQLQAMIDEGVNAALATCDATRNGDDSHTPGTGARRPVQAARECSYSEFLKCKPLDFKAHAMTWVTLKKKITDKYCPRDEIKKIEAEMWNLKADNKRKSKDIARNNQNQQPNKRQNTGQAYTAGNGDRKLYAGSRPLCSKCNYNHEGPCQPKCNNCKRVGHITKDYRIRPANNNNRNNNNQQGNRCFECGAQGHFKRNCPKLKNNDCGNQAGNDRAPAMVYAVRNAGANLDNVVAGTFLLNNRYAYILFDTGADRSFVSTAFSSQIDIAPSTLDHYYDVELADGRIIGLNTILKGCTLNLLNHTFNID
nr:hypothetical protein [Tanacetum cinerariifolium]